MNYDKLNYYLSNSRFGRFVGASGGNEQLGWQAYALNLRVSRTFYPRLHLFEVFLRNAIHRKLATHFSDPDWILNEVRDFMADPSLGASKYFLRTETERAIQRTRKSGSTTGKVIAELNFGYWTALFLPHHYQLLKGCILGCFPCKPTHINRRDISVRLDAVRDFRNRVYHNEPICFVHHVLDYKPAQEIETLIEQLCDWMDPDLKGVIRLFPVEYS